MYAAETQAVVQKAEYGDIYGRGICISKKSKYK